jgi:hypothetical protein
MAINEDIKNAIRSLADKHEEVYSIVCIVDDVDVSGKTCNCSPINGDAKLLNVRLMTDITKVGIFVTPSVNSQVMVTMINKYTGYVSMFSELDEIQLNGKDKDGLVQVADLVTKLNNLENLVNAHILAYKSHTHLGVTVGMGATGITTPDTQTLTPTTQIELENKTVLHGTG